MVNDLRNDIFNSIKTSGVLQAHHVELLLSDEYISELGKFNIEICANAIVDLGIPWKRVAIPDDALKQLALNANQRGMYNTVIIQRLRWCALA